MAEAIGSRITPRTGRETEHVVPHAADDVYPEHGVCPDLLTRVVVSGAGGPVWDADGLHDRGRRRIRARLTTGLAGNTPSARPRLVAIPRITTPIGKPSWIG